MAQQLSLFEENHREQLQTWMGWPRVSYKTLFKGSEQNHTPAAFHAACDNKGPTVVIVRTGNGGVFGGYTSANWDSSNTAVQDPTACLFQLEPVPRRYTVAAGQNAITKNPNAGPMFGNGDLVVYQPGGVLGPNFITSTLSAVYPFTPAPGSALQPNTALAGMLPPYGLIDVEVLQVIPGVVGPETPLKSYAEINFTDEGVMEARRRVSSWVPAFSDTLGITKAILLLIGALGAGKSAAINTSVTSLSDSKGIRHIAPSRTSLHSVTKKLTGYDLTKLRTERKEPLGNMVLIDPAGWSGANYPGLELMLDGRVPINNTMVVGDATLFSSRSPDIRGENSVTHAQLANIDAYCQSMALLQDSIMEKGLAAVAVITGIDEDETVKRRGLKAAYSSKSLHHARRDVADKLSINPGQVYLLKNYQEESQPSNEVDALTIFFIQGIQQQVDCLFDRVALGIQHVHNLPSFTSIDAKNNKSNKN